VAAVALNGRIYVIGGLGPPNAGFRVEVYDPARDTWSAAPPMPTARHGLGAAAVGSTVYVLVGGLSPGGGSPSAVNEAFAPR
jgi:N-acetylneuraminic acid mutarotase